jgi:zinc/manganese transport system substrate-binding protein
MSKTVRNLLRVWIPLALTVLLAGTAVLVGNDPIKQEADRVSQSKIWTKSQRGPVTVLTSVGVWRDIAAQIGQGKVLAKSIMATQAQDPHSYVATPRDQLAFNESNVTIANGLGYDTFFQRLSDSGPIKDPASKLTIGCHLGCDGNPHVWYSLAQVRTAVPKISQLIASGFAASQSGVESQLIVAHQAVAYQQKIDALTAKVEALKPATSAKPFLLTEGFASYLLRDLKMVDATPTGFRTAVENEQDASPLVMNQMHDLLIQHKVSVLITNRQTSNSQTTQLAAWARSAGIPVLAWSELLPENKTYLQWMTANLNQIQGVLK